MTKYVIPLNPVTKKHHQHTEKDRRTNRKYIVASADYDSYIHNCKLMVKPVETFQKPVTVKCLFYINNNYGVNLVDLLEVADDVLVECGILPDENCKYIVSYDGSRVIQERKNPRTEIYIEEYNNGNKI